MEINDYSDLSDFITNEIAKNSEILTNPSPKVISYLEQELIRYTKLYSKPLYLKEKLNIKVEMALESMPHGKIWKFFHPLLWKKIQEIECEDAPVKELENTQEKNQENLQLIKGLVPIIKHEVVMPENEEDEE